jgi:hypothetical protein
MLPSIDRAAAGRQQIKQWCMEQAEATVVPVPSAIPPPKTEEADTEPARANEVDQDFVELMANTRTKQASRWGPCNKECWTKVNEIHWFKLD